MRKLILISALLLASVSAQAGEYRSLSLAGIPTVTTTAAVNGTATPEAPKPIAEVSARLAQAAITASDAAPIQVQAPAQAPASTQTTTATSTASKPAATTAETKPAKTVKKVRRESDEHKARRIAARYGMYW